MRSYLGNYLKRTDLQNNPERNFGADDEWVLESVHNSLRFILLSRRDFQAINRVDTNNGEVRAEEWNKERRSEWEIEYVSDL